MSDIDWKAENAKKTAAVEEAHREIERLRKVNDLRGSALLKSDEYIFALEGRLERLRAALREMRALAQSMPGFGLLSEVEYEETMKRAREALGDE